MAEKSGDQNQKNVLQSLKDNIRLVSQQIKDGECKRENEESFVKDDYWTRMSAIFKLLSTETTKISLAFSKKPFPSYKNTEQMVVQLERAMLSLVSAYYSLPNSQGSALRKHLQDAVLQILNSLASFTSAVANCLCSEKPSERIQWTGGVWEAASFTLLTDNKQCIQKDLKDSLELIGDALSEIDDAKENDGQVDDFLLGEEEDSNSSTWSDQDRCVVDACTGMVKATKMVLKKSLESVTKRGDASTEDGIVLLEELSVLTQGASCRVDDFVCGIYAPINYTGLVNNGKNLSELTNNILKFLRDSKLTCPEDAKWLDFLTKANTHNLGKLEAAVLPHNENDT